MSNVGNSFSVFYEKDMHEWYDDMKQVACIVEDIPSYLGHLLSVSRIFESSYSDRYEATFNSTDADWLKSNEDLFKWGNGVAGPLTSYGLFLLGYVNPDGSKGIESYFDSLLVLVDTGTSDKMLREFPPLVHFHEQWGRLDYPEVVKMLREHRNEIELFRSILCRNWNRFTEDVWPVEKPKISARAEDMNIKLQEVDAIARWENATGFPFKHDRYEYILSSGMKNAPRFNSLGYGKNWVYHDIPLLFEGILHEIGSHVLIDLHRELRDEFEDYLLLYNVRETLCSHLTKMIFSDYGVELTPVDGSKVFDVRADELFRKRMDSLPVADIRNEYLKVMKILTE